MFNWTSLYFFGPFSVAMWQITRGYILSSILPKNTYCDTISLASGMIWKMGRPGAPLVETSPNSKKFQNEMKDTRTGPLPECTQWIQHSSCQQFLTSPPRNMSNLGYPKGQSLAGSPPSILKTAEPVNHALSSESICGISGFILACVSVS